MSPVDDLDDLGAFVAAGPVLLDGAWGTQLQARGLGLGELPDTWNLEHPDRVEAVARSYAEAGSRVVLTNTFRANRVAWPGSPDAGYLRDLNRTGVELSRAGAAGRARVFASIGPSGKLLVAGDVSEDELREAFAEQAAALAEGRPDALVIETMSDLGEARIALDAARATGLPVVACMVFDSGKRKDRTMTGVTPVQAAEALSAAGADAVGANCGTGVAAYRPVCEALVAATDRPVWIKPNAGLPELVGGEAVYRTTPGEFAAGVEALVAAGAAFVGGCCGTGPDHIAAAAHRLSPGG